MPCFAGQRSGALCIPGRTKSPRGGLKSTQFHGPGATAGRQALAQHPHRDPDHLPVLRAKQTSVSASAGAKPHIRPHASAPPAPRQKGALEKAGREISSFLPGLSAADARGTRYLAFCLSRLYKLSLHTHTQTYTHTHTHTHTPRAEFGTLARLRDAPGTRLAREWGVPMCRHAEGLEFRNGAEAASLV